MRLLIAVAVVLAAVGAFAIADGGTTAATPPGPEPVVDIGKTDQIWPYTSKSRSTAGRTLAINVIIRGDPTNVRMALANQTNVEWNRSRGDTEGEIQVSDADLDWGGARGADRYSYVQRGDRGRWVGESYQLSSGAYLGERHHVRAYATSDWTAVQAHREYWDWFRLRHSVTGISPAARYLEQDLEDEPFVSEYRRMYHGHHGGGSAGWLGIVVIGSVVGFERVRRDVGSVDLAGALALAGGVATVHAGVRTAGVLLEGLFPAVTPKLFVVMLYPLLVGGLPLVAVRLGRERRPTVAFVAAAGGLAGAVVADFAALEVVRLSPGLLWSRVYIVGAVGALAAGGSYAARGDQRPLVLAAFGWAIALAIPLFEL